MTAGGLGHILIVDDDQSVREVLSEYFLEQGYTVDTAGDGEHAVALVRENSPEIVLLDVRLPGTPGVETLQRIRTIASSIPVIMVTANEDVALAREALKLGALDYVAKPFDFVHLERAVMAGLARAAHAGGEVWHDLLYVTFQAVRGMNAAGRASTGVRLEAAALAAAREAGAGRVDAAAAALAEIELLLGVAARLGDISGAGPGAIRGALERTRQSLRTQR